MERKPLDVNVGDKVTSKQLKDNGLVNKNSELMKSHKTWKVIEMDVSQITIAGHNSKRRKKQPQTKIRTRIVLEGGRGENKKTFRTFWLT
jgi:hypothetical protein